MFSYNAWWGYRTPDKRSETIPSSRITPDPSDSQIHDGASSLQFTSLIFYRVQVRGLEWPKQNLGFVLSDPFLCCFWGLWLEEPNMAHYKISESQSLTDLYLLVFDRIHDVMCLNKMSRTSSRNIGQQHIKYSSRLHCTHRVFFYPCVHQTHLECLLIKSYFFCFIWP